MSSLSTNTSEFRRSPTPVPGSDAPKPETLGSNQGDKKTEEGSTGAASDVLLHQYQPPEQKSSAFGGQGTVEDKSVGAASTGTADTGFATRVDASGTADNDNKPHYEDTTTTPQHGGVYGGTSNYGNGAEQSVVSRSNDLGSTVG